MHKNICVKHQDVSAQNFFKQPSLISGVKIILLISLIHQERHPLLNVLSVWQLVPQLYCSK